jgi:hypothetical protein
MPKKRRSEKPAGIPASEQPPVAAESPGAETPETPDHEDMQMTESESRPQSDGRMEPEHPEDDAAPSDSPELDTSRRNPSKFGNKPLPSLRLPAMKMPTNILGRLRSKRLWLTVLAILGVLGISLLGWWQWERSWVAIVGGKYVPITELDKQLRATNGTELLPQIVQQQLVLLEADAKKIAVGPNEVDKELQKFKDSVGGEDEYQSALKNYNITERLLRDRIQVRLSLEQLLKDKLVISDDEIKKYYEENKERIDPQDEGMDKIKSNISEALRQQKLQQESEPYMTELENKYKVTVDLSNANLTFGQFMQENVLAAPQQLWGMITKR